MIDSVSSEIEHIAVNLLKQGGFSRLVSLKPLPGGRNNRVFHVICADVSYFLKRYFFHPADGRDRLAQEFSFLGYLQRIGCHAAPRPLASDHEKHAGLMEFVAGVRPKLEEIDEQSVDQACLFYAEANEQGARSLAASLPNASEACFSIADHLQKTQRRVDRLEQIREDNENAAKAVQFIRSELTPLWCDVRARILNEWPDEAERNQVLPQIDQCLSPSDFGFHNALRQPNGKLKFLDFEYAGWDDPAKLICDFANQPDMPLPRSLTERFRKTVLTLSRNPDALQRRAQWLEPLYQIKWACICLNCFLDVGHSRERFTNSQNMDFAAVQAFQLERARQMSGRVLHQDSEWVANGITTEVKKSI